MVVDKYKRAAKSEPSWKHKNDANSKTQTNQSNRKTLQTKMLEKQKMEANGKTLQIAKFCV